MSKAHCAFMRAHTSLTFMHHIMKIRYYDHSYYVSNILELVEPTLIGSDKVSMIMNTKPFFNEGLKICNNEYLHSLH